MLQLLWLLPRSTSRAFPERNDLELIRTRRWTGLPQRRQRMGLAAMSLLLCRERIAVYGTHRVFRLRDQGLPRRVSTDKSVLSPLAASHSGLKILD
jgi:hypothetical protein